MYLCIHIHKKVHVYIAVYLCNYIYCLQHYRMLEVARDRWRSSGPTPPQKQGHPDQVAHVQVAFQDLQGGKLSISYQYPN